MTVAKLRRALTVPEFAGLAGVSPQTVYRQIRAGLISAARIGTCLRIDQAEYERWLSGRDEKESA